MLGCITVRLQSDETHSALESCFQCIQPSQFGGNQLDDQLLGHLESRVDQSIAQCRPDVNQQLLRRERLRQRRMECFKARVGRRHDPRIPVQPAIGAPTGSLS